MVQSAIPGGERHPGGFYAQQPKPTSCLGKRDQPTEIISGFLNIRLVLVPDRVGCVVRFEEPDLSVSFDVAPVLRA